MIPLGLFMIVFDELMREKLDRLRLGMKLLGTQDAAYWTSWMITAQVFNIYMSTLMILVGRAFGFTIFTNAPFWVWFILYFEVSTAYLTIAFFAVTIAETKAHGFTVNFTMILGSMLINMVLSDPQALRKLFFNLDQP